MDLQAAATHLAIAVESLSCVELFSHLSCELYSVVCLWRGRRALCISCVLGQQVVPETLCTPVVTETLNQGCAQTFGGAIALTWKKGTMSTHTHTLTVYLLPYYLFVWTISSNITVTQIKVLLLL